MLFPSILILEFCNAELQYNRKPFHYFVRNSEEAKFSKFSSPDFSKGIDDFLQSFARKNIFIFISLKFNGKDSANSRWFSVIAIFKLSNV